MIAKDEALVLHWHPVSNTSRMVLWLTRKHGLVATLIKGSQRPKSDFIGQYDLFYTCELLFYLRERRDWFYTRECSPLDTRSGLRHRWRQCAAASWLARLVPQILPRNVPHPALYDLMTAVLDRLEQGIDPGPLILWTELHLLRDAGHQPVLHRCVGCGQPWEERFKSLRFDHERGGIVCRACRDPHSRHEERLSPAVRGLLEQWLVETDPDKALRFLPTPAQRQEAGHLLRHFLAWHLHVDPWPRDLAARFFLSDQPASHVA